MTFAIITPALIVGAFAERMKFSGMMLFQYSLVYILLPANLPYGMGRRWRPFSLIGSVLDFAGGTVVHVNAGIAGLVTCLLLGPRKGFPKGANASA